MRLVAPRRPVQPDGLPLLLLTVNLLLLSFFVLLNALASAPTSKSERHADDVLARIREGYEAAAPNPQADGGLPQQAVAMWGAEVTQRVQGVLTNRLQLPVALEPLAAERLRVRLPLTALFAGDVLANPELVRALQLALRETNVRWQLRGPATAVATQAAQLGPLVGAVSFQPAATAELVLLISPRPTTAPTATTGLEAVISPRGGSASGEANP